jgi:asparagine synthase (glutamine-hydrolysing)
MRKLLPASILKRPKMGFPVPIQHWLRGTFFNLGKHVLTSESARQRGLFNPDYVDQLLREHQQGQRDHGERLWFLLNFEIWQRIFLDNHSPADVSEQLTTHRRSKAA